MCCCRWVKNSKWDDDVENFVHLLKSKYCCFSWNSHLLLSSWWCWRWYVTQSQKKKTSSKVTQKKRQGEKEKKKFNTKIWHIPNGCALFLITNFSLGLVYREQNNSMASLPLGGISSAIFRKFFFSVQGFSGFRLGHNGLFQDERCGQPIKMVFRFDLLIKFFFSSLNGHFIHKTTSIMFLIYFYWPRFWTIFAFSMQST